MSTLTIKSLPVWMIPPEVAKQMALDVRKNKPRKETSVS